MSFMESVTDFVKSIPKPVILGGIILILVIGFFVWKKVSNKSKEANHKKDDDAETTPVVAAVTKTYQKEVQEGLDSETTVATSPPELEPFGEDTEAEYTS
jgi:MFS superfamily sulfate permease-like transporter